MEFVSMVTTSGKPDDGSVADPRSSIVYPTMVCLALGLMPDGSVILESNPELVIALVAHPDMTATVCPPMS